MSGPTETIASAEPWWAFLLDVWVVIESQIVNGYAVPLLCLTLVWIGALYFLEQLLYRPTENAKNAVHTHTLQSDFEFGGPHGALRNVLALPILCYALFHLCNDEGCAHLEMLWDKPWSEWVMPFHSVHPWFTWEAVYMVAGWISMLVVFYYLVPSRVVQGGVIRHQMMGTGIKYRLDYPMNGFRSCVLATLVIFGLVHWEYLPADLGYTHFLPLLTVCILLSFGLSIYCYAYSFYYSNERVADGGNSGYLVYDFWMGRPLNPRVKDFDFKFFCELRPGLFGWLLLDLSMAAAQYGRHGYVSNSMVLVCVFHAYYVCDALWSEEAILSTMDITTDGFGFMLAFGDLAWVPFTYSTQARFLVDYPVDLSWIAVVSILTLNMVGMFVFRSSNSEKARFRADPTHPSVKHLKTLATKRGTKLLVSGWWGMSRHPNYFGDWLMGLSYCLPCGTKSALPYFYIIYFTILLVHRGMRDDVKCKEKYGKDWEKYCAIVRYKIIPYVY